MREVKEKSPLKERVGETLKSAPRTAFRRGIDASFQQLRQELRDAAQDGQSEDRYESGKITDTAYRVVTVKLTSKKISLKHLLLMIVVVLKHQSTITVTLRFLRLSNCLDLGE